jgi:ABC-type Fe3+/spermidine/putrescine transport system ATPase subunit
VVTSSIYLGTATQLVVELKGGARMTVLCPNTNEAERQSLPGGGAEVKLAWTPEHIHLVRESGAERATADHEALPRDASAQPSA